MRFEPDYRHFAAVMQNQRPERLPLYEHIINVESMEAILDESFADLIKGDQADREEFFRHHCGFFRQMTYDVVSFEAGLRRAFPGPHALSGGKGALQTRADMDAFPWDDIPQRYWAFAEPQLTALTTVLPPGMKAVGGVANGVFELAEDLVGLEFLPYMEADDPELYAELFVRIGDLMVAVWSTFLPRYGDAFIACRFGDDLGYRSSLLTNPRTVRQHIIPQYKRVIDLIHQHGKHFLWHSCGNIFEIMDDVIALGIDAKHSNEDGIAPYDEWIERYGDRIGLVGGFDLDFLCRGTPDEIEQRVFEDGQRFRRTARGYALGSGNSIPGYLPAENYLAMVRGAQRIREKEQSD